MNAFNKFSPPESKRPDDWASATEQHLSNLEKPDLGAVRRVLDEVRMAVHAKRVEFTSGDVPQAVNFANRLLDAARKTLPGFDAWHMEAVVPPAVAVFVQAAEEGTHYAFQPMYTL